MATEVELRSSFLKDVLEEEEYQKNVKSIQDWLTGQTQAAQQQYQATAKTAAEQASYDISGAYANYLKQQRNVASQGRLESGYKEEVGDALQQQYQSAYGQAKATQAQSVASAQNAYTKAVQQYGETASKAATSYYESAVKEAEQRAKLYKAAEEYAGFTEDSQFDLYNRVDGKYTLSDYGSEVMRSKLLGESEGFKKYLEDEGLTDTLEFYLSDAKGLNEALFGITDTKYDPQSEESFKRRLSAVTKEGVSYIDTLEKPVLNVNWNDFGRIDFGESGFNKLKATNSSISDYAKTQLGLTDDEIKSALGYDKYTKYSVTDVLDMALAEIGHRLQGSTSYDQINPQKDFNDLLKKLDDKAKSKYIKE